MVANFFETENGRSDDKGEIFYLPSMINNFVDSLNSFDKIFFLIYNLLICSY